jgi:type III restriction enzyme
MARKRKAKRTQKETIIRLDQRLPEVTGRDSHSIPAKHLVPDKKGGYIEKDERRPSKTLLVNQVREEVDRWRKNGYERPRGVSDTSKRLMEWWFDETHFSQNGVPFKYYFAQREAIETIIYLYEVSKKQEAADLIFRYMDPKAYADDLFTTRKKIEETTRQRRILKRIVPETGLIAHQEIPAPDHYRYAIKMATGTGKTLVMAMAVAWSYFHKKFERESNLSKSFLIIAPNIIVFERLREDFEGGKIFHEWDLIPNEWKYDWQMTYILRGESRKTSTEGTLYLTNIHQLYEPRNNNNYNDPVNRLLGPNPKEATGSWEEDLLDRIKAHDDLLIINDEAHHVHDEDLEWMQVILRLHNHLKDKGGKGISIQLDFTATPKDQNGTFFPWIICDYPLAQAIEDRIVKAPLIVHQTDKSDPEKYDRASVAYAEWVSIAISRWKDHHNAYRRVKKEPVLFIMAENTRDADDIYASLKTKGEFKGDGQLLLIHTDKKGEIQKRDLEKARKAARLIDEPENKIRAIVSVMMLREGWDVRGVSVILGLRPFTAKANILPEQAVGRGLRLMQGVGPGYIQIVEIIGTQKFEEFVRQLEIEGVGVGYTRLTPDMGQYVFPHRAKMNFDIEIPLLSPSYTREVKGLHSSLIDDLPKNPRGLKIVEGIVNKVDLVETVTQKTVAQKKVMIDEAVPDTHQILINLTNRICKEARMDGHFAVVYPLLRRYLQNIFFGQAIDLDNKKIRRLLTDSRNTAEIIRTLSKTIGDKSITTTTVKMKGDPLRLSELDGFYWKRMWVELDKTIFNITPCFNDFEKHFAQFLDQANDITKFAKLAETYTKFSIEYINHKGAISYYYPDFVAEQKKGEEITMWLIETKGWEQEDVPLKDARAERWCKDASRLTETTWKYVKIKYPDYMALSKNLSKMPANQFAEFIVRLDERNTVRQTELL